VLWAIWHGPREPRWAGAAIGDATRHEVAVAAPLVAAVFALGMLPRLLLDVTGPAVRALLAAGGRG
jgi:NADH:ubiquinone oxidoreductase subunit 4 (subunit M)